MKTNGENMFKDYIRQLYFRFKDDNITALSAQLSFYLMLSIFPFLLFLLNILSFTTIPISELTQNIIRFMPRESGKFIAEVILEMLNAKSPALLSISALITIWSASVGMGALNKGLNKAYDIEESRSFLKIKGASIIFTISIALILIVILLFLIFGNMIGEFLSKLFLDSAAFNELWWLLRYTVPLTAMIFIFLLLYICVPNCRIRFKDAFPGAVFSTIGWIIISMIFSFYVNNFSNYTKIYGSIGGIIILLIWLYISSMIILFGGEINATVKYFRSNKEKNKYNKQESKSSY